ncbi:MAG: beta-ketoacyl-ACP synthase II [Dehalococcoidia bacterium]
MSRRVVITGLGAVTSLGTGVEQSWQALCAGRSGITRITRFDASSLRTQIASEVKDFHAEDFMDKKMARRTDRFEQFALAVAQMAVADAGLEINHSNGTRVGVSMGTILGGMESVLDAQELWFKGAASQISPFMVPMLIGNMAAGQVAMRLGARGPNLAPNTACATGTYAVGESFRLIQRGEVDAMIAGGSEAGVIPVIIEGLAVMGATSTRNDQPEKASRPFDRDRDGLTPGEAAAAVVLEELHSALGRGASIYAEVIGFAANCDAYHITSPSPGGEGAARCMTLALQDARISPDEVDYINAHGTSTQYNDAAETQAVKTVFGEHSKRLAMSSNKSMLGHTFAASGAVEAVFTCLTIKEGLIPPTINYETPDPECDLDYVPNEARRATVRVALSNSFGFGGNNAVLILREFVS